jgi:hypothetical protein
VKHFQRPWGTIVILIIVEVLTRGCTSIDLVFLTIYYAVLIVRLIVVVIFFSFWEHNMNKTNINVYSEAGF